ncbi:MAG: phosphatase PAP2 family protein [Gammaproteobacteria bacterium]|nr:phosphatase PAP2 family protein [Gammaproteobacteria bacterium]
MSRRARSMLLLLMALSAPAQARDWWADTQDYLASPTRWQVEQWQKLGGVVLLTGLAMQADDAVREGVLANQGPSGDTLAAVGNGWGELDSLAGLTLLGIYGTGLAREDTSLVRLSANGLEAVVLSGLTTAVGKQLFGRVRPAAAVDSKQWFQGQQSFPSGHTTAAFALSTVLAESGTPSLGRRVFFYSLAGLTAFARMYDNRHWLSDTVMGAAIGIHAGRYVTRRHPLAGSEGSVYLLPQPNGVMFVRVWSP